MILNNWSVVKRDPYIAPEMQSSCLRGQVTGHSEIADGEYVTTSSIISNADGKITTVSGSVYELGDVDPEYEKVYPNAAERIFQESV